MVSIYNMLSMWLDAFFAGVARGCGWQHIGAYVNLSSFYLFGIPIASLLGFWFELRGKGLWIGILCGATLQTILLSVFTGFTNWKKQVLSTFSILISTLWQSHIDWRVVSWTESHYSKNYICIFKSKITFYTYILNYEHSWWSCQLATLLVSIFHACSFVRHL